MSNHVPLASATSCEPATSHRHTQNRPRRATRRLLSVFYRVRKFTLISEICFYGASGPTAAVTRDLPSNQSEQPHMHKQCTRIARQTATHYHVPVQGPSGHRSAVACQPATEAEARARASGIHRLERNSALTGNHSGSGYRADTEKHATGRSAHSSLLCARASWWACMEVMQAQLMEQRLFDDLVRDEKAISGKCTTQWNSINHS